MFLRNFKVHNPRYGEVRLGSADKFFACVVKGFRLAFCGKAATGSVSLIQRIGKKEFPLFPFL